MSRELLSGAPGSYGLGVDLGTTFVAAAIAYGSRVEMFTLGDRTVVAPAVVHVRGDGHLVLGEAANRRAVSSPDWTGSGFKRRLGDPVPVMLGGAPHAVTALLAALLADAVERVTATEGAPPERVVLTHPANWGPYRRELFEEVPQAAGLAQVLTVTEPEAAAAHYAATRRLSDGDTIAVYDLGGGTFDSAVLRKRAAGIEILGTPEGIERLGGVDFDDAILAHINFISGGALSELDMSNPQTVVSLARLRRDCILAKEALSVDTETTIPVFLPNRHFDVRITRAEFEDMIRAQVESTIGALTRTLRSADIQPDELDAVLLVGGCSRIPLVARSVAEALGRPVSVDAHPKYPVALGAAMVAVETGQTSSTPSGWHRPPAEPTERRTGIRPGTGQARRSPTARQVFVSYRTSDTGGTAGRLGDALVDRFGRDRVFLDVESVDPGVDYREAVQAAINQTRVMLIVIGDRWLVAADRFGRPRLADDDDLLRYEIEYALDTGVTVVPVLVDGFPMPGRDELPATIARLTSINAVLVGNRTWRRDLANLLTLVERLL